MEVVARSEASLLVPVREASQVADARRKALAQATTLGLADETKATLALLVSEAASNLVKHAREGVCVLRALARLGANATLERGIELLFLDRGPGMGNVAACLTDGYSTAGSMGTGFGAMRRAASAFDVYSVVGLGTALVLELWDAPPRRPAPDERRRLVHGAVSVAKPDETACGDGWAVAGRNLQASFLLVDGLGHGEAAAQVSAQAIARFLRVPASDPARALADLDAELHGTRGAAAAVATVDAQRGLVQYCGVGNISGTLFHADGVRRMVSHAGTLGLGARKVQLFEYAWTPATTLVLHSDGLSSRWDLERYPGLARRHPSLLAGVLYRDFARATDDATVLVARETT